MIGHLALATLSVALALPALSAQTPPRVELEAALAREQVDGDLKAAMASYQKIALDAAAPRDVRAKALLLLGGCYEKIGRQAQGVYQQIVREFGEQPAAAQARARLVAIRRTERPVLPVTTTQRKIEIPGGSFGPQATDGRRMVYRDDATGNLIYSDTITKIRRVIFKAKLDDVPAWMPARDFSMVALQFERKPNRPAFIALVQITGMGYRELLHDDAQGGLLGSAGGMMNWSWDGQSLLVASQDTGRRDPRLLVVSISSGERRDIGIREAGHLESCAFSPDAHFVACSLYPEFGVLGRAKILVWPAQGGAPHPIEQEGLRNSWESNYRSLRLLDWTADGRFLTICSSHTGKSALHLYPFKDGQAAGEPILIRSGRFESGATTKTGELIYQVSKAGGFFVVHVASLDAGSRPGNWQRLERGGGRPSWAPDSNQLVYTTWDLDSELGNSIVRVHNISTSQDREIYRGQGFVFCAWAVQQPRIFCSEGTDRTEILSITPESGQVERLGAFPMTFVTMGRPSQDNLNLYLSRMENGNDIAFRWNIATGQETVLAEFAGDTECCSVSPDERWLLRVDDRHAVVRPISGGEWSVLPDSYHQTTITADRRWFFYHGVDSARNHSVFRVPTAKPDATPERLGVYPSPALHGRIEISPDGRRVVTASYDYDHGFELWALANFVPPPKR